MVTWKTENILSDERRIVRVWVFIYGLKEASSQGTVNLSGETIPCN